MRHPNQNYTTEDALALARSIIHGPLPPKDAPTPSIEEAIAAIEECRRRSDFNWITGQVPWRRSGPARAVPLGAGRPPRPDAGGAIRLQGAGAEKELLRESGLCDFSKG